MLNEIITIMRKVFDLDMSVNINPTDTSETIASWDSLNQMKLISSLEELYDLRFDLSDLLQMDSPLEIESVITKKLQEKRT